MILIFFFQFPNSNVILKQNLNLEKTMKISESIKYVGVDDHKIDLFEGQFPVPHGMAYNSYLILDDKCAVMDGVEEDFADEWLSKIKSESNGRKIDYLVVQHMEMDHSGSIGKFAAAFPEAKIVSSKVAFTMMKSMLQTDFSDSGRQIVVAEGAKIELGKHVLNFIAAPNVHWPEVIMTYESTEKILFSADAFGKFGANDFEDPEGWDCEARRYYFGIVGRFGLNVQNVLKKAANLEISKICSLHGHVLDSDISYYLKKYDVWSSYKAEDDGVAVAYTSVYGNTKKAAEKLFEILKAKGAEVKIMDLAREDIYECVEDAFRYSKLVLATTTYNGGVFPRMREFIENLTERNFQNRTVAFIENGSWAPSAARNMEKMFENSKDIKILGEKVTVKIALTKENEAQLEKLADSLLA